tara:strand:+ start:104 stop:874 length:771 start_codon:yes stop_codon:yes gene_type:complete
MKNNLFFLGTGTSQGVPVIGCSCTVCKSSDSKDCRLRSSVLIQLAEKNILIDTGPDFRYQMLRQDVRNIDAVLYTHEHRDHVAGIDDLRSFYYLNKQPISMFMTKQVYDAFKKDYSYLFSKKEYFGKPKLNVTIIDKSNPFHVFSNKIIPIEAMHYKLPVLGYRILDLAYLTDANYVNEKELEKLQGLDVLIINCLQKKPHISHFNLDQVLELINFLKPRVSYLTHISHNLGLHNQIQKELPKNVYLAFDQLKISF